MKISLNWLKQHLNTTLSVEELAAILTDIGLEVEGVTPIESVKGSLKGLVIGEIKKVLPHPNADRLQCTKVDVGHAELLEIVCGAPNVAEGQKVVVALVGSTLYPDEKGFEIKKSKIRGEVSEGMICAEDEIGLGDSHDGIMVLAADAKIGMQAAEYFGVSTDTVIEIGLTPNRIDAASHYGVARDLAAYLNLSEEVALKKPSIAHFKVQTNDVKIEVELKDLNDCPRYSALTINNVTVKDSPQWLQNYLKAIGLKPINNIVDATNYVLHDIGQPLHAFDATKINGQKVIVRKAEENQTFTTLDGVERKLSVDDLMICNAKEPMCIAGVFGGIQSGVNSETKAVFLESAYFNPVSIRKTAKRHGLNTDASFRYERGTDPNITVDGLKQAALLIQELAGGEISSELIDLYPTPVEDKLIELNFDEINRLIGQPIPKNTVKQILKNLEIKLLNESKNSLRLSIPAYRVDVTREVDLIEEILRIYGYNRIELPDFLRSNISAVPKTSPTQVENKIADFLCSRGFAELFNNSLTNPNYYQNDVGLVKMLNPLSKETEVMRASMLYGGLESIAYNQNRKRKSLKFYEFGRTYTKVEKGKYEETRSLGIWLSGNQQAETWQTSQQAIDFYNLKEVVEGILKRLGVNKYKAENFNDNRFNACLKLTKGKKQLVVFGKLNIQELNKCDIKETVYFAEFNWDEVLRLITNKRIQYVPVAKYPIVRRDLALLLDQSVEYDQIKQIARETEKRILKETNLFDVYEGKKMAEGKKSYAVSFFFQDENKTLTDVHVDKVMDRLINALQKELKAVLR